MGTQTLRPLTSVKGGGLTWIMAKKNDPRTLKALRDSFNYHQVDLADTAPPVQRQKLVERDKYLFMILQYPVFNRETRIITSAEVDFYIEPDRLVTVDSVGLAPLQDLYRAFQDSVKPGSAIQGPLFADIPHLMYGILNDLTTSIHPMLRHLTADVEDIEDKLFTDFERALIKDLLRVKTNIVNVRKCMQGHKMIIRRLIEAAERRYPDSRRFEEYFDRLVDETKEIWGELELQKDTINALHETSASLVDFQINEIMRTLTMISVIVIPLTLLASIFGMNAVSMPFVSQPYGFWMIIFIMAAGVVGMLAYFRYKKWL